MSEKPTYEELEQRIKELEKESDELKQALEAVSDSEKNYRTNFENSMDALFITAPDGRVEDVNPAACEMFGYTREEVMQLGRGAVVDPDDDRLRHALEERARTGKFSGKLEDSQGWVNFGRRFRLKVGHYCMPICSVLRP